LDRDRRRRASVKPLYEPLSIDHDLMVPDVHERSLASIAQQTTITATRPLDWRTRRFRLSNARGWA
jgi:hypothetical protein